MLEWLRNKTARPLIEEEVYMPGELPMTSGAVGILTGTEIATDRGWRRVEDLCVGDRVLTFDHGWQCIRDIQREIRSAGMSMETRIVKVPAGALGNSQDIQLMPDQGQLIETEAACDTLGDPYAIVRARSLVGFRGVTLETCSQQLEARSLSFDRDEVVYSASGFPLYCPSPKDPMDMLGDIYAPSYAIPGRRQAQAMLTRMLAQDTPHGFVSDPDELAQVA